MTKQEEQDYIDSLYGIKSNILSPGEKTRRILKSKGIESPPTKGLVKISSTPPTWKVPKKTAKKNRSKKK
tara:strand:+ start:1524 stop:1733 length:210 start_codon:yes stop_codon:yes gene_type:complete